METADSFGECFKDVELERAEGFVKAVDLELEAAFEKIALLIFKKIENRFEFAKDAG